MPSGPCTMCGATDYALSMGGPAICPRCDCGLPPQKTVNVVQTTWDPIGGRPIDVPSIMRAGGFEEGVAAERAILVAWLRAGCGTGDAHAVRSPSVVADLIERCEHLRPREG